MAIWVGSVHLLETECLKISVKPLPDILVVDAPRLHAVDHPHAFGPIDPWPPVRLQLS